MKNLKTFSVVALIAIAVLFIIDFTSGVGSIDFDSEGLHLSEYECTILVQFGLSIVLFAYFFLVRKECGFAAKIGMTATGLAILGFLIFYSTYGDYMRHDGDLEDIESTKNMMDMAIILIEASSLVILATVGTLASSATTARVKWAIFILIVAYVLPHVEKELIGFFKPDVSDFENLEEGYEIYEQELKEYRENCHIFTKIVHYLPLAGWALFFFGRMGEGNSSQGEATATAEPIE